MTQKGQERLDAIYAYITTNGYASVAELSKLFNVSESTIKRDLDLLDQQELVQRKHGGAFSCSEAAVPPFSFRTKAAKREKFRIAQAASALIEDGDVIFIDAGSTNFALYQQITAKNVTIFTTSLSVLTTPNEHISHVYALEGEAFPKSMVLRGALCVENLERINPDKVFLSSMGISRDYEILNKYDTDRVFVRQLLRMACQRILLMDSTKFGRAGMFRSAPIQQADLMITDSGIQPSDADAIRARGLELMIV